MTGPARIAAAGTHFPIFSSVNDARRGTSKRMDKKQRQMEACRDIVQLIREIAREVADEVMDEHLDDYEHKEKPAEVT
jgi:DNA-binding FadR family transcriptional regulator